MKIQQKFKGNGKEQKVLIQVSDETFDFTQYNTHIIITDNGEEILNVYAETLVVSKKQKIKNSLEILLRGNNILVKIESNYEHNFVIFFN